MIERRFELTAEGYLEAKAFLQLAGEWETAKRSEWADGYSFVQLANYLYNRPPDPKEA